MVKFIKNCFSDKNKEKLHEEISLKKLEKVNNYFELIFEGKNRIYVDIDGDLEIEFIKSESKFDELDNKIIMELMKLENISIISSSNFGSMKCEYVNNKEVVKSINPKLSYRITFINEYCESLNEMSKVVENEKTPVIKDLLNNVIEVKFKGSKSEKNYLNIDSSVYREGKIRCVNAYKYDKQPDRINKLILGEIEDTIISIIPKNCKLVKNQIIKDVKEVKEKKEKKEKKDVEIVENEPINDNTVLNKIMEHLNVKRFDNYDDWFKIACVFVNENYDLNIFDKFSKNSSSYNKIGNDNIIKRLKKNEKGYRVSTLYFMLKEDNYKVWKELQSERKDFWDMMEKFNHYDLAQLFFNMYPEKYIYSNLTWYELNEYNIYKEVEDYKESLFNNISSAVQTLIIEQRNLILPTDKYYMEKNRMVKNNYNSIGNSNFKRGVLESLCGFYSKKDLVFNNKFHLLAFNNKVYDIEIGEFRDIRPDDYITICTKYDAPEKSDKKIRDKINKLLFSIFEDEEIIKYWLATISLAFFTNKFESLYIHTGNGRNGKGVLSEILKKVFGEYYYSSTNDLLTGEVKSNTNSTLVKARYSRLLVISEPDDTGKEYKLKTSLVKQITGNDDITVRDLYKSNITYKPMFTVILQCNKKPAIDRVDKAMEERLKVIHYPFTFVDNPKLESERLRDYSLKDMINKDINFIKEFVLLLLESAFYNYKLQNIKLPNKIIQKNNEYFNENNPVKEFLDDKFIITNNSKDKIKASILYSLYGEDETLPDLSLVKFSEALGLNNIKKIKEKDGLYYIGLKLK